MRSPRDGDKRVANFAFLGEAVILKLYEEIVLPENVHVFERDQFGFFWLALEDELGNFAADARAQGDEAVGKFPEQGLVHRGL